MKIYCTKLDVKDQIYSYNSIFGNMFQRPYQLDSISCRLRF